MTENNLYFFKENCDKRENILNINIDNAGASPTDIYTTLKYITPNKRLFKHGNEIDKASMLKADSYEELITKINTRLNKKYSPSKVKWVWKIQDLWNNAELDYLENGYTVLNYSKLINELRFTIESKANYFEKRYKYKRLSFHDFEAELWDITYKAIEYYEMAGDLETEFMLLETLELFWKNRMKNFIKRCNYTEKPSEWYKTPSLTDDFEKKLPLNNSNNPERIYIDKETVIAMFNDIDLADKERQLLTVIYDYPKGSLREWGKEIGIDHPQSVKRLFQSLQKKLKKHICM